MGNWLEGTFQETFKLYLMRELFLKKNWLGFYLSPLQLTDCGGNCQTGKLKFVT